MDWSISQKPQPIFEIAPSETKSASYSSFWNNMRIIHGFSDMILRNPAGYVPLVKKMVWNWK